MHARIIVLLSSLFSITGAIDLSKSGSLADTDIFPRTLQFDLSHEYSLRSVVEGGEQIPFLSDYTSPVAASPSLLLKAVQTTVYRPKSFEAVEHARLRSLFEAQSEPVEWVETRVLGPDVADRHTLAQLGRMAANAYQLPGRNNWYELDPSWNVNAVGRHLVHINGVRVGLT